MSVAGSIVRACGSPAYFGHARPEMLQFIPAQRCKILEIGCGEGNFARSIPGVLEAWGVEPDNKAANLAASHIHFVHNGLYNDAEPNLPDHYFNVVI